VNPLIEQLIEQIAEILEVSVDKVKDNFTQDQLDDLLSKSACGNIDGNIPLFDTLDYPCNDQGTPLDLSNEANPDTLDDILKKQEDDSDDIMLSPDPTKCLDTVDEVNEMVEKQIVEYNDHLIILERLYELQDNIKPLGEYYKHRIKRAAEIIGEFRPVLKEIKRLEAKITRIKSKITNIENDISDLYDALLSGNILELVEQLTTKKANLYVELQNEQHSLNEQNTILDNKSQQYPALSDGTITGLNSNSNLIQRGLYITEVSTSLGLGEIGDIKRGLQDYSEYIKTNIISGASSYSDIISNPLIRFELKFQNLIQTQIEREKFDKQTGDKSIYTDYVKIKDSSLLNTKSFFEGAPGYSVTNTSAKEESQGSLYTKYYNKFNDPLNKFFTASERGLTGNSNLVDKDLQGTDATTKKEGKTTFYIKDKDKMESFYKEFEARLDNRKKEVRQDATDINGEDLKKVATSLRQLAAKDVEALVATGRVNVSILEDNSKLRTIFNKISEADEKFAQKIIDLDSEIDRLEIKVEELKPDPDKIKTKLKELNEECFGDIDKDVDPDGDACDDVKQKLGSDTFFDTITEGDGSMPNFTQMCYWVEFAKLATIHGLTPMPNQNPTEFRYWPVGLLIPTPAQLIKIPLPIIWIPLVVISTPMGVLVLFLTINGIFISPILFFLSSSGYKQHLITVRGSSEKFGYDQFDDSIKTTIKIPINITALAEKIKRLSLPNPLTSKELKEIAQFKEKLKNPDIANVSARKKKIEKEIEERKIAAENRIKGDAEKAMEVLDKKETLVDALKDAKKSIMKRIDDLGNPGSDAIDKLKEKSYNIKKKLQERKLKAMEDGDTEEVKKINKLLKGDGIDYNDKIKAFTDDLSKYFDKIKLPKIVIPKDEAKIDPKPNALDGVKKQVTELTSNFQTQFNPPEFTKAKHIFSLNLAKHKKFLEDIDIDGRLDLNEGKDKVVGAVNKMLDNLVNACVGIGKKGKPPTDDDIGKDQQSQSKIIELEEDKKKLENAIDKLKKSQEVAGNSFDLNLNFASLTKSMAMISQLGAIKVDLNPFAPCCKKEDFSLDLGAIGPILVILMMAKNLIKSQIESMSIPELKALFGGKPEISVRDLRLGILTTIRTTIPDSLEVPVPSIDFSGIASAFGGLTSALSLPQASFPAPMKALSFPKQFTLDLNMLKAPLTQLLPDFLEGGMGMGSIPQDFNSDLMTINSKDIKAMIKSFVETNIDSLADVLQSAYTLVEIAKSAKGVDLNVLENAVFNVPPYGKVSEILFIAKGLLKMNLPNSLGYSNIDLAALKPALILIKPLLLPIVSSPAASVLVAAAGMAEQLDTIRLLHPILNEDDIPPWERLSLSNLLFLIFLDEFCSTAADQVGFFRAYL